MAGIVFIGAGECGIKSTTGSRPMGAVVDLALLSDPAHNVKKLLRAA